jgi:hypothetical protein
LNHPGLGVTTREFRGEWGTLVPSFVEKLKILIESILEPQYLTKKLILGKSVTGGEFREFVVAYLEAFQNSKLPDVENIYQATLRSQIKSIKQDQVNFYKENVEAFKIDYNDNSLESTYFNFTPESNINVCNNFLMLTSLKIWKVILLHSIGTIS